MAIFDPRTRPRTTRAGKRGGMLYDAAAPPRRRQPPPPPNWRSEIVGLSGLNVLAGIWLIIAPWVLTYGARDPKWNDVVFGAIVAVLAFSRVMGATGVGIGAYRLEILSLINALIGGWLVVAAFTIDFSVRASWNDVVLGVIVFLLAVSSADAAARLPFRRSTRRD